MRWCILPAHTHYKYDSTLTNQTQNPRSRARDGKSARDRGRIGILAKETQCKQQRQKPTEQVHTFTRTDGRVPRSARTRRGVAST